MQRLDRTRLNSFRQLKKEIRGSERYLVVGLDIGKEKHHAFFGTTRGKSLLRRLVFENSLAGFEKLLEQTEAVRVRHGLQEAVFGFEPTANYHKPLGDFLVRRRQHVVMVSGVAAKENRKSLDGRWDKYDEKDAANVADLVAQGKFLFYEYVDQGLRELRDLLALKRRLKKQEHGIRVRIRNHLVAKYFPELDRYYDQSETCGLAIMRWCLDPQVLSAMEFEKFTKLVCRKNGNGSQNRLRSIWEKARDSIGCQVGEAAEYEAKVMVEGLKQIRTVIAETERKIEALCMECPEYHCLLTIPGFGPDVSAKVLAAIGDPFRFDTGKQVLKLAGWDLNAERSGQNSASARPVISKKGKAVLRFALYQAAFIASTKNREFIIYFTNKLRGREKEPGIKTKMRVKLAAKLLIIAWTLMKKEEVFNPDYLNIE